MGFGIAKFRIAKFSHCEFGIAKFSHCEFSHCEIFALRMWYCENFRIAKLHFALRNAQYPVATVPLVLHPAASHPVFNCISFPPLCLGFSFDLWVV